MRIDDVFGLWLLGLAVASLFTGLPAILLWVGNLAYWLLYWGAWQKAQQSVGQTSSETAADLVSVAGLRPLAVAGYVLYLALVLTTFFGYFSLQLLIMCVLHGWVWHAHKKYTVTQPAAPVAAAPQPALQTPTTTAPPPASAPAANSNYTDEIRRCDRAITRLTGLLELRQEELDELQDAAHPGARAEVQRLTDQIARLEAQLARREDLRADHVSRAAEGEGARLPWQANPFLADSTLTATDRRLTADEDAVCAEVEAELSADA